MKRLTGLTNTVLPQARNKRSTEALRHLGWGLLGAAAAAYLRHRVRICTMLSPCCSGPGMACQECQECFAMASAQLNVHGVCATCLFLQVVKVTLVARGRRIRLSQSSLFWRSVSGPATITSAHWIAKRAYVSANCKERIKAVTGICSRCSLMMPNGASRDICEMLWG